ncbi:MAG: hypothetical protein JSW68_03925, partial [Burkholderiales bacterium]
MEARHEPKRDSGFFGTAVSLTGRAVRLIAAVGCAAIPLLVQAGSTNLPMRGGGGGTTFTLDCGDDEVLIGASGRRGQWIDQIRGRCIKVTNENTWAGSVTTTARRGNNNLGTTGFTITCPRNTAVKRISGRFGWYVHRISLRCVPLGSSGTSSTITASGSSAGPTAFGWDTCPDNKPARGFRGASGSYIHRIGLVCHSGTTPTLQVAAAPTNLVAVNLVTTSGPSTTSATPFVQFQWIDRSTFESGYRVVANPDPLNSLTASRRRSFDRPA